MDTDVLRRGVVITILCLYIVYGIFYIGVTGLLMSAAIGLIIGSLNFSLELTTAIVILIGILWQTVVLRRIEKFTGERTGTGNNLKDITKKIEQVQRRDAFQPTGVLSSNFVEGFADSNASTSTPDSGSTASKPAGEKTPPPSTSTPASTSAPTATAALANALPAASAAASSTPPTTSGFSDRATDGMFKLGSIPPEAKGGAHIDVGTTLMNALNSLKPDQVKQMTEDSRKLMETQKSLMGMLGNMKPMVQDGKQLMETFQEMFGNMK
jgi:hypothetical protein